MNILMPSLILGIIGLLFGIGLAIASKKFAVQIDSRLEAVHGLLPGSNCGACGGAGCFGFAEELLSGKKNIEACKVSEDIVKERIAKILGKNFEKKEKLVAVMHCGGGKRVKNRFLYQGIKTCVAANLVLGGQKECVYGCLGFGDCAIACSFGAITMSKEEELPVVNFEKCTACNKCVEVCPKKLFTLIPYKKLVYIACNSLDNGKDTKAVCPVGCIACRICEKISPQVYKVENNLSRINYDAVGKTNAWQEAVEKCPTNCIAWKK